MKPTLKQLREEVRKVKKMFISHTHKMSREECEIFLTAFKGVYKPIVEVVERRPESVGKKKSRGTEEYDF